MPGGLLIEWLACNTVCSYVNPPLARSRMPGCRHNIMESFAGQFHLTEILVLEPRTDVVEYVLRETQYIRLVAPFSRSHDAHYAANERVTASLVCDRVFNSVGGVAQLRRQGCPICPAPAVHRRHALCREISVHVEASTASSRPGELRTSHRKPYTTPQVPTFTSPPPL